LWDLTTGEQIGEFEHIHTGPVRQVQFLPDGKRLLTASEDTTVMLWDIASRKPIRTFKGHTGEVRGLALRPNHNQFLSGAGGDSNLLLLWDVDCATPSATECDTPLRIFDQTKGGHSQELNQLTFTSDGARALTTSRDGALVVWNVDTGDVLKHFEPEEESEVRAAVVLPGDRYALTAGDGSGEMYLWDLDSPNPGTIVRTFTGHARGLYDVAISPDGQYALSGSNDNTMMLWDLTDEAPVQRPLQVFHGHGLYIREVVFSHDGRHALTGSKDKTMRYWDLASGAEQTRWPSPDKISIGALSPDGRYMVTGGVSANLWDRTTGQVTKRFSWHGRDVKAVAFSADGQWIASGGDKRDGAIFITDITTGQIVQKFKFDTFGINALAFSPDRKYVVSGQVKPGEADYQEVPTLSRELDKIGMILWDANTGEVITKFPKMESNANAVAFSPDGKQVLAAVGGDLTIWAVPSGDPIKTIPVDKGKINVVDVSADGTLAITGGADKKAVVVNLATGERVYTSDVLSAEITGVALSPDGNYAAASAEGKLYVYDLTTRQLVRTLLGHTKFVRLLRFDADGRTLVSGAEDRTVRTWRLDTRKEMIAWAQSNRYFPDLTCDQEKHFGLDQSHC
jgi:WD40 repeat protein